MLHRNDEWTTSQVSGTRAIDYWNEVLTEHVIELDVRSDVTRGFGGHITATPLAQQAAFLISATHNQRAVHTARASSAHADPDNYVLIHMRSGQLNLSTRTHDTSLRTGDAVLLSAAEAFRFDSPECTSSLVLQFSHDWLKRWLPLADDCLGQPVHGNAGWGRTLSSALWNIDPAEISDWRNPPADVAEQVAGLLTLALEPRRARPAHDALVGRLLSIMRSRYEEPALSPADVATAVGISKRYLHQLFAGSGATFSQTLSQLRLAQACRLLGNRTNDRLTVTEIALRCGYSDGSYFTRVFRKAMQTTPSAYRRGVRD